MRRIGLSPNRRNWRSNSSTNRITSRVTMWTLQNQHKALTSIKILPRSTTLLVQTVIKLQHKTILLAIAMVAVKLILTAKRIKHLQTHTLKIRAPKQTSSWQKLRAMSRWLLLSKIWQQKTSRLLQSTQQRRMPCMHTTVLSISMARLTSTVLTRKLLHRRPALLPGLALKPFTKRVLE